MPPPRGVGVLCPGYWAADPLCVRCLPRPHSLCRRIGRPRLGLNPKDHSICKVQTGRHTRQADGGAWTLEAAMSAGSVT
eukprot:1140096-Prymnesium_polylepis.1